MNAIAFLIGMAAGAAPLGLILRQVVLDAARNRARAFQERGLRIQAQQSAPAQVPPGPLPIELAVGTAE